MFFKATAVKGGGEEAHAPIVLNSSVILGLHYANYKRVLLPRHILEELGMEIFYDAKKISHVEVTEEVAQSLLDNK